MRQGLYNLFRKTRIGLKHHSSHYSSVVRSKLQVVVVVGLTVSSTLIFIPACRDLGNSSELGLSPVSLSITSLPEGTTEQTYTAPSGSSFISVDVDFRGLTPSAICRGTTLFGVKGTAFCEPSCTDPFLSYSNRDIGTIQLGSGSTATGYYHLVPVILTDDEGSFTSELQANQPAACKNDSTGASCITSPVKSIPKTSHDAFLVCGNSQNTIAQRIADCKTLNSASVPGGLPWKGKTNAGGGQSTWNLVTVSQIPNPATMDYREVWQDSQTGLLWSSRAPAPLGAPGWCRAAGNNDTNDPYSYCNSNVISYCSEILAPNSATLTAGFDISYRGGMSQSTTPAVRWRLPTLPDYKVARANGITLVMADMGAMGYWQAKTQNPSNNSYEWTATIDSYGSGSSSGKKNAYYISADGQVGSVSRDSSGLYARCVGG